MFTIIWTDTYLEELSRWTKADREIAEKIPKQLRENPFAGDALNYRFLREKRVHEKRVYCLIYEDLKLVLLAATSGKKDQQATIDHIKKSLDAFRREAEKIVKQAAWNDPFLNPRGCLRTGVSDQNPILPASSNADTHALE